MIGTDAVLGSEVVVAAEHGEGRRICAFDDVVQKIDAVLVARKPKRFSSGLNQGIPKRLAMMESFVH
jgi:hypothetical protein